MSAITFSGLSSGIDSAQIIQQLVYLERAPIRNLQQSKSDYQSQKSIVQSINSKLQALQTKVQSMDTLPEFLSYTATSTDTDKFTATASGSANPGTYQIEIFQLAAAERTYSNAFASKDTADAAGNGTLTITIGSEVDTVEVLATDTLEDIVNKINASDAEVSASLLSTSAGYRIQVTGNDSGAANAITFEEEASSTLNLGLDIVDNQVQAAQDASLEIDDFAVTSADNAVDDAIQGVTLNLLEETTTALEVTVAPDTAAIKTKVSEFVDAYNEVMTLVQKEFDFTGEAKGQDRLAGDGTLRSLKQQLGTLISTEISGLTGSYSALSQIGLKTNTDGTLAIDDDDLESAIASDTVGVGQVFAGTSDHSVDGISDSMDTIVDSFVDFADGILTAKINGLNTRIDNISDSILRYEDRATKKEESLRLQFTNLEVMISQLTSQSNFLSSQSFLWG
ncbi:MAG: flagellar filament capping protein FliD [Myxococcota bacterium]|nr:flagellar filament capping protein FliD [Myxococcota bacterium]